MSTILILLVGIAIVIGGVLWLRLHPFLVLIVAALVVSLLTPKANVYQSIALKHSQNVVAFDAHQRRIEFETDDAFDKDVDLIVILRDIAGNFQRIAQVEIAQSVGENANARYAEIHKASTSDYQWQAGDIATTVQADANATAVADNSVGGRVAAGFGETCLKIGILIAMAAIIGNCLLASGAADRIVRSTLKLFGERRAPAAFVGSSFLLSIPVYFDTVFYLMIPLGKAMRLQTGKNYLFFVLAIFAGGTMAHSLVPPTPGPLFVAGELNVEIGMMILVGGIVGLFTSTGGYFYAWFVNRRNELQLPETQTESELNSDAEIDAARIVIRDESELPSLWFSLLPIVLPLILIASHTIVKNAKLNLPDVLMQAIATLGNPNVALTLSAGAGILLLMSGGKTSRKDLSKSIQSALSSGGVIILITAAGGAFGQAMRQTSVATLIESLPTGSALITLPLAFAVTALIRTAQGSATVAMITSVGILGGIASSGDLGFHPVYLAVAIGCGSKPLSWMNDSGFWVISKLSGMTEREGLKYITPMSGVMGIVGLVVTVVGALLFPMNG